MEIARVVEVALRGGDRPLSMNPSPDVSVDCRPGLDVTDTTFPALDIIESTGLWLDATEMTPNPGIAIWASPEHADPPALMLRDPSRLGSFRSAAI